MLYAVLGLVVLASVGFGLYGLLKSRELNAQVATLDEALDRAEEVHRSEVEAIRAELARLDRFKDVPGILDRARRAREEIAARWEAAQKQADELLLAANRNAGRLVESAAGRLRDAENQSAEILRAARQQAQQERDGILAESRATLKEAKEANKVARWQAENLLDDARSQARKILGEARKEAKEKTGKAEDALAATSAYARDVRTRAEQRAKEIGGKGFQALGKAEHYEAIARAMEHAVDGYQDAYLIPADHILDDMAEEFGFNSSAERLKLARERTRLMERDDLAATCDYPEGWKRDYAIKFVLGAFNGKVDSILARIKPANHGRLVQEIKDAYALTNHNGSVFKDARIEPEYLAARLDELKWGVAVQALKERQREEQRAIREQIREEEKARREYERAIKQTQKVEEEIGRAIERTRKEFEQAGEAERTKYEAKLVALEASLREAEEKNKRALSMAQQTKCGHVYVISNVGSFGEDVYKIGLTRRLEPLDRIRELGDASVPFPFDVHALIYSEDAPALETALHKMFLDMQVNKANRRKEFFRLNLGSIRQVVQEMGLDVRWTLAAEAREYRETLALEEAMNADPAFKTRWLSEQAAIENNAEQGAWDEADGDATEPAPAEDPAVV